MEQTPRPIKTEDFSKTLPPPKITWRPPYSAMLQGPGTTKLIQLSPRKIPPEIDAITGCATINLGTMTVFIEEYNALEAGLRISTHKLLDVCTITLTAQNNYRGKGSLNREVSISLEDYMERLGKPLTKTSKDKTRREVNKDLDVLYSTSIEWSETRRGQVREFAKMRICDMIAIKNGNIIINFSEPFAGYLNNSYITQFCEGLLKLDERNPNLYPLGKKLILHYGMGNNQIKGTATRLSVKVLLEYMRHIPSYEDVMRTDRHVERRIITAFEKTLDGLSSIITWEYSNSKGEPLTEEQIQNFNYGAFKNCYVSYTPVHHPNPIPRLQAKTGKAKKRGKGL